MIRRILLAATVAFAALAGHGGPATAATPFRIVMIGDSIGTQVFPLVTGPAIHWDAEPGRSPYDVGGEDRATTVQALGVLSKTIANSSANFIVVQEGGTGTLDGRVIPIAEWTAFIYDVLRLTAGKCLVFVYPGYGHTINGVANESNNDIAYQRTIVASQIFDDYSHRCILTVNWWFAANGNPSYLQADGLHPSPAGAAWIAGQLNSILPNT